MIRSANLSKEIVVKISNKIGTLAKISKLVSDHGINIVAVAGYGKAFPPGAEIMMVTDDNLRATDALKKGNFGSVAERDVVILELENRPGVLIQALAPENLQVGMVSSVNPS